MNQGFLQEALLFDAKTGAFTWRHRPRCHFVTDKGWRVFNARYAGRPAGHLSAEGYVVIGLLGKVYKAHRLAWLLEHGVLPADAQLDHMNRCRHDNRITNLRLVGPLENAQNASRRSDNTSGLSGVGWHKATGKWSAQISVSGKRRHLGLFASPVLAAAARANAVQQFHSVPSAP